MKYRFRWNTEKMIPRDFKDCYEPDPTASALWRWADGLLTAGKVVLVILILIGTVVTIYNTSDASKLIDEIGDDGIKALRLEGTIIPSAFEVFLANAFKWATYAVIGFCGFFAASLVIGGLASIVQHNKITADILLYQQAKDEKHDSGDKPKNITYNKDAVVEPDELPDNLVVCPVCKTKQLNSREDCWKCGAKLR